MDHSQFISFVLIIFSPFLLAGCEGGLEPPVEETNPTGVITGVVTYSGEWPPADSLKDLRFVPLKSVPQTTQDIFADFNNLVFSERLDFNVEQDTFSISQVPNGVYVYNSVAQNYGTITEWRPVGLYEENDGIIIMDGDTISITIHVDFDNLPPFDIE